MSCQVGHPKHPRTELKVYTAPVGLVEQLVGTGKVLRQARLATHIQRHKDEAHNREPSNSAQQIPLSNTGRR